VGQARQRLQSGAPLALLVILVALLGYFMVQAVGALGRAGVTQPAEPWAPAPQFSRAPSGQGADLRVSLWPTQMAGRQPLQSLAVQFDNPSISQGAMLLTVRNADGSTGVFPFSAADVHDNDYVAFPMEGKVPISAQVTSNGGSLDTIEVRSPDTPPATCAIYELMDGTKLTVPGCS
jgi:hypothetical protein